ncbi:hypothetical protein Tco_0810805 [Tanacetum coccineum]
MKIIKGALLLMRGEKVVANLYQLKGEIMEEAEASVASHSPSKKFSISPQQNLHNAVIFQLGDVKKDKHSCKNITSEIARDINSLAPEADILQ